MHGNLEAAATFAEAVKEMIRGKAVTPTAYVRFELRLKSIAIFNRFSIIQGKMAAEVMYNIAIEAIELKKFEQAEAWLR